MSIGSWRPTGRIVRRQGKQARIRAAAAVRRWYRGTGGPAGMMVAASIIDTRQMPTRTAPKIVLSTAWAALPNVCADMPRAHTRRPMLLGPVLGLGLVLVGV